MGLGFGFGTGLRGLNAARLAMQVVGQNVANVNTPGFTRQRALLASSFPTRSGSGFFIGSGVNIETVQRVLDARLDARIRTQNGLFGQASVGYQRTSEIEGILGEPGDGGISSLMNRFFGAVSKLRTDAGQRALRGGMIQEAQSLASGFNLTASRLGSLRSDTFREVGALTNEVNDLAETIAKLNTQILTLESSRHAANDLRDRRETAISQLSELMDTQAVERKDGSLDILASGYLLVSGGSHSSLRAIKDGNGGTELRIGNSSNKLTVTAGKIAGLLQSEDGSIPELLANFDKLANKLALEVNRVHTTGMAKNGPFTSLVSENAIRDGDSDGEFADEPLSFGGLPFDVTNGELFIAVTDLKSGNVERSRIGIDPASMTLGDFADAISSIEHLNATVDPTGRLRMTSDKGFGFDFSKRLDSAPNTAGTFAGTSAALGGKNSGPFDLNTLPADFQISVDGAAATTITLTGNDFNTPSAVSASEFASVLNAKFGAATLGVKAQVVGNTISFVTSSAGSASSLRVTDGANSPAAVLGLPTATTATGRATGVAVSVSGEYKGTSNGHLRFVAEADGQVGVTDGLSVGVFDQSGTKIATLNVGKGYSPGDRIQFGDGLEVTFGPGTISKTTGDQFALDTLADPDTADILVALGLNTFFTGSTAADLGVAKRISDDPDLLAAGISLVNGTSKSHGDAGNLVRLEELRKQSFAALNGGTIEGFYSEVASDIGFEAKKAKELLVSQDSLHTFLTNQREAVSGVNIDEEMVDLVRFQQAFQASSRFINVMTQVSDTLINLAR